MSTYRSEDFSIAISRDAARMYLVTMTLAGETITCDGIKFVMDVEDFGTFTYENWVEYFHFMKEEWEM